MYHLMYHLMQVFDAHQPNYLIYPFEVGSLCLQIYKFTSATSIWQTATSKPIRDHLGIVPTSWKFYHWLKQKEWLESLMTTMTKCFPPLGRARDLGSLILLTSLIPIRLKPRQFILNIGQPKSSILIVRAYAYMSIPQASTYRSVQIKRATACKVRVTIDYSKINIEVKYRML